MSDRAPGLRGIGAGRAYNAHTVKRLLEIGQPPPAEPVPPLTRSRTLSELTDDVDPGTLEDYAELDQLEDEEDSDVP